jgi:hypothetical protein
MAFWGSLAYKQCLGGFGVAKSQASPWDLETRVSHDCYRERLSTFACHATSKGIPISSRAIAPTNNG